MLRLACWCHLTSVPFQQAYSSFSIRSTFGVLNTIKRKHLMTELRNGVPVGWETTHQKLVFINFDHWIFLHLNLDCWGVNVTLQSVQN